MTMEFIYWPIFVFFFYENGVNMATNKRLLTYLLTFINIHKLKQKEKYLNETWLIQIIAPKSLL